MKIMGDDKIIEGDVDLISTLPDVILQDILCFIPTKLAISTSLLSRRWRHVWCDMPSISLDVDTLTADSVNETLTSYTAPKTTSFHLIISNTMEDIPHIDRWIKLAMSRHVENLSLNVRGYYKDYELPDFFYNTSSFKQLNITLNHDRHTIASLKCSVTWTSLQKLFLSCNLFGDSLAKILSGCPILENLTLDACGELKILDLSKFPHVRILKVISTGWFPGPSQIVAPHIHCLELVDCDLSCTLVDVSSLTEANLGYYYISLNPEPIGDYLQVRVLEMLEKLKNAEKLTLEINFTQILSLAEIRGVPFPMLKVKTLTLDAKISRYVIPGIERLIQNSPDLEKLTISGRSCSSIHGEDLDRYLKLQSLSPDQCWRSKDGFAWKKSHLKVQPKHVTSLVELVLKNTKRLEKLVLLLDERYLKFKIEEVVVSTLPHNDNVTIVLSSTNNAMMTLEELLQIHYIDPYIEKDNKRRFGLLTKSPGLKWRY